MAGVEPPRFALGGTEQPAAPLAIAVGLVAEELDPRERARVLDVGGVRPDGGADPADELVVEREEEVGLVPAEPYWRLIAPYFIFGGPGGSCVRICSQICPRGRIWAILRGANSCALQGIPEG